MLSPRHSRRVGRDDARSAPMTSSQAPPPAPMDSSIAADGKDGGRQATADGLSRLLADSYTLYLKTHNYHWNVTGPSPLWKQVPSWFIFGDQDRNIPVAAQRAMADRANSKRTIEIAGASHVVGMSHPAETAQLIGEAAASSQP